MKRAIVLGGGGPAVGLQIGALLRFAEANIEFDIWALSGVGAWTGVIYNQFDWYTTSATDRARATLSFMRHNAFRPDAIYNKFPISPVFGPDLGGSAKAMRKYVTDPESYRGLYTPGAMTKVMYDALIMMADESATQGDFNRLVLEMASAHPMARYIVNMLWRSSTHGIARRYFPDGTTLAKHLQLDFLYQNRAFICFNAWNLHRGEMAYFANKERSGYRLIDIQNLCACSALPFVESVVEIDGEAYCEGAMHSVLNFEFDRAGLDEIWIIRIIDTAQVRPPKNLTDGLGNLIMLPVASIGELQIRNFRHDLIASEWPGKLIEVPISADINFDWTHSNLALGAFRGYEAINEILTLQIG